MQAEKPDHMRDALAARRGKGLDIIIGVGPHPDGAALPMEEKKEDYNPRSDLAPPPEGHDGKGMESVAQDPGVQEHMAMHPEHTDALEDVDLIKGMSEHDKTDAMSRKPRSLMERARQFALSKKK